MKRGEIVTVAVQGDYGKPCPAVVIQPGLAGRDGERAGLFADQHHAGGALVPTAMAAVQRLASPTAKTE